MATDHYFSSSPGSREQRREIEVELAGRPVRVVTAGGVFSPERVDTGTSVLLRKAPPPASSGALLDLGCGWGPVALSLALLSPGADVYGVDVNERAVELLRDNAARLGLDRLRACLPGEVPEDVRFATIWSNPPIRVGKALLHDLLATWLPRLEPDGEAYLVVQRNLGADSLQRWISETLSLDCDRHAVGSGFRVLRVRPAK